MFLPCFPGSAMTRVVVLVERMLRGSPLFFLRRLFSVGRPRYARESFLLAPPIRECRPPSSPPPHHPGRFFRFPPAPFCSFRSSRTRFPRFIIMLCCALMVLGGFFFFLRKSFATPSLRAPIRFACGGTLSHASIHFPCGHLVAAIPSLSLFFPSSLRQPSSPSSRPLREEDFAPEWESPRPWPLLRPNITNLFPSRLGRGRR